MAKEETFSHVARLGGLRPRVMNRYVAVAAAVNMADPRAGADVADFIRHFFRWLEDGENNHEDRELRRAILLEVTRSMRKHGLTGDEDAGKITAMVEDLYNAVP